MKTLRLTKPESAAYAAGERCFWRAMKPQPEATGSNGGKLRGIVWNDVFDQWDAQYFGDNPRLVGRCPYGTPNDRIEVIHSTCPGCTHATITAITVTQRDGKWGWLMEVGV